MPDYDPSRDPQPAAEAGATDKTQKILVRAREDARINDYIYSKLDRAGQSDLAFLAGHQWDPVDAALRRNAGRVTLTINDLGQYMDQVIGDLRMNPTQIRVRAADWGATKSEFVSVQGKKYSPADVRAGLFRNIEYRCMAPAHYALAGQHAAESGLGWLRVYSDYIDRKGFAQCLKVERIKNRFSVRADVMATEPDWSDMNNAQVGEWVRLDDFKRKYPNATPGAINNDDTGFWGREGYVRESEIYWRDEDKIDLLQLDNGTTVSSDNKEAFAAAKVSGRVVNQRKAAIKRVYWAKATYHNLLTKPVLLPGERIPLVPVIGKRIEGDEDDLLFGIARFAKDPKIMENYLMSAITERMSLTPSAPWTISKEQIKGYENQWAQANNPLKAYLTFNPDPDVQGHPQRTQPAQIPAGEMQLLLAFGDKVKGAIGFHDAGIGISRNDQSGRAIEKLQNESDVGAFVFSDNLRWAVGSVGKIFNDWLPAIYDTERFITIRMENGEVDVIPINQVAEDGSLINDLTSGEFEVHCEAGPSYSTLRQQSAETMLELMGQDPQAAVAYRDIMLENSDFPGADRAAKRARKMVPPNLLSEDELTPEERNAPPAPPPPEVQAEMAKSEATMATADAAKDTARATKAKAAASIAESQNAMVQALAGSPESAERDFNLDRQANDNAEREKAEAAAKPKPGKLDPAIEDAMREMILNLLAEASAEQPAQGAPANGTA